MSLGIFIPGRTTSQRLPNKLLLPMGDTCLWEIACSNLAEINKKYNYNVYALAYEKELIDIAEKYDLNVIIRSEESIYCDAPLTKVFNDINKIEDEYIMFLNPCHPFLTPMEVAFSCKNFEISNYNCGTSVRKFKNWLFNSDGAPITNINYKELNTKTINGYYQVAHCFHVFNKEYFFKTGNMLNKNIKLLEVTEMAVIDVDTLEEYNYAKWKWESLRNRP